MTTPLSGSPSSGPPSAGPGPTDPYAQPPPSGGQPGRSGQGQPGPPPAPTGMPWSRSSGDRVLAGVCGGLGRRLGIDPVILRVVVVVLSFFAGAGIVLYAAAWLFLPLDQTNQSVITDALGGSSTDRLRSVLTAGALLLVLATAVVLALDGGFVPGLLIAIAVVAVLAVVRRDQDGGGASRPAYAMPPPSGTAFDQPMAYGTGPIPQPTPTTSSDPMEPTVTLPSQGPPPGDTQVLPRPPVGPTTSAGWSSGYVPPPPPPLYTPVQPPPPPAPPRERSTLGVLAISVALVVLGAMGIVDAAGASVPLAAYVVAALSVVAAGLVLGAWYGRSRGLIALGAVLALALPPAVAVDAVAGSDWQDWGSAENIRLTPRSVDELAPAYDYGAGSIRLDLTELGVVDESLSTSVEVGAGEVVVIVPDDLDVVVDSSVSVGEATAFGQRSSGFDAGNDLTDVGSDGPGGGRLDLTVDIGLGRLEVRRASS